MTNSKDIFAYAHWKGMETPKCIGVLSAEQAKGRKAFSFTYDKAWISSEEQLMLDPDIAWFSGRQFPLAKENFGMFLDSMPDTWGRTLMRRRAAVSASEQGKVARVLYDIDYLLGVHDLSRMGALRFKTSPDGEFLDNNPLSPAPPWTSVPELQYAASIIESGNDNEAVRKWLTMLMAPGSSLGGARPKANVLDEHGELWIAKFPAKTDTVDKGAWEYLAYRLAVNAGIQMADCRLEKITGTHHTFFTKRFDREKTDRIHFASAMTMTGKNEELIRNETPSYLDIVEFIRFSANHPTEDLHQLWRRIVFNVLISNTDDHLRNHGFILAPDGWRLSPAFDLNPSIDKNGLAQNIDTENNALDLDLVKSVGVFFSLSAKQMKFIIDEVKSSVANWQKLAAEIGIPRAERTMMQAAFR